MSVLSNSLKLLQEEVADVESPLIKAGEERMRMMKEMVVGIEATLRSLEDVARRYDMLGSNSKRKRWKAKIQWSLDLSIIDKLRNKVGISLK